MEWRWFVYFIVIHMQENVQVHFVTCVGASTVISSVLLNHQKSNTSTPGSHKNILQELDNCNWGQVASVSIEDAGLAKSSKRTLDLLHLHKFAIIHYKIPHTLETNERLKNIIWNSYSQQHLTDFIVLTGCPECVVRIATDVFQKEKRGAGALMTNRLRLVILTWIPIKHLRPYFKSVIFDNVALVVVKERSLDIEAVYTLMWRSNATREFETVSYVGKHSNRTHVCHFFPNMNFGLNGRALEGLSKEWVTYLYKTPNQLTGNMTYAGFSVAVIESLAADMNFSYTLVPVPGLDDALTWRDYESLIQDQAADFGADLYISNMMTYLNTSVSFPVISGDIRGIYKPPRTREASHFDVIRKSGLYLGVVLSLFSTVGFYLLIERCIFKRNARGMCDKTMPHHNATHFLTRLHTNPPGSSRSKRFSLRNLRTQKNNDKDLENIELQHIAIVDTVQTNQRRNETSKCLTHTDSIETNCVAEHKNLNYDRLSVHSSLSTTNLLIGQRKRGSSSRRGTGVLKILRTHFRICARQKVKTTTKTRQQRSVTIQKASLLKQGNNSSVVLDINTDNANVSDAGVAGIRENLHQSCQNQNKDSESQTSKPDSIVPCNAPKVYIMDIFFAFLGSICGQGTLPSPPLFSARLLLCSWCLTLITTSAIFNGGLTADFLDNSDSIPFRTFADLIARADYKWGLYNESTFFKIMEFSKPGTLFHQIYTGVITFLKTDPCVLGSFEDIHRKLMTEKFVAILDTFSQKYLENVKNLTDFIVLSDVLMTINMGYVFPKDSELEGAFSKHIMKLVEHGVIEDIFRKSFPRYRIRTHKSVNDDNAINQSTMMDLIRICGIGAAISVVILILECIVGNTKVLDVSRKVFRRSLTAVKHL